MSSVAGKSTLKVLFDKVFTYDALTHAISGVVGGFVVMSALYPLDVLRTHLQITDKKEGEKEKSTLTQIKEYIDREGSSSLYRGLAPVLFSLACSNFIFFYTYNCLKVIYSEKLNGGKGPTGGKVKEITSGTNLLIAAIAGCVNVLTTCPLWVVNTRLKMQRKRANKSEKLNGILDGLIKIPKKEGLGALWGGCGASLVLVSNPTLQFVAYDKMKNFLLRRGAKSQLSSHEIFLLGALAKSFSTIVTYPLQVAQSRLRAQDKFIVKKPKQTTNDDDSKDDVEAQKLKKRKRYRSTFDCLIKLFQKDGFFGWYKGLNIKLTQTVLSAAFHFLIYEEIAKLIFGIMKVKSKPKRKFD